MSPRQSALATSIDGEAVILETESGTYYGLNTVGTVIWELLEDVDTASVESLREHVLETYDIPREQCEQDIEAFLSEMEAKGLLEIEHTAESL